MEGAVLEAITHAVRAVERRSEGLAAVADRHRKAATAALKRIGDRLDEGPACALSW